MMKHIAATYLLAPAQVLLVLLAGALGSSASATPRGGCISTASGLVELPIVGCTTGDISAGPRSISRAILEREILQRYLPGDEIIMLTYFASPGRHGRPEWPAAMSFRGLETRMVTESLGGSARSPCVRVLELRRDVFPSKTPAQGELVVPMVLLSRGTCPEPDPKKREGDLNRLTIFPDAIDEVWPHLVSIVPVGPLRSGQAGHVTVRCADRKSSPEHLQECARVAMIARFLAASIHPGTVWRSSVVTEADALGTFLVVQFDVVSPPQHAPSHEKVGDD